MIEFPEFKKLSKILGKNIVKSCILELVCPGDSGETEVLYRGHLFKLSKASSVIKL